MKMLQRPERARRREWRGASGRQPGSGTERSAERRPLTARRIWEAAPCRRVLQNGWPRQSLRWVRLQDAKQGSAAGGCLAYPSSSAGYREFRSRLRRLLHSAAPLCAFALLEVFSLPCRGQDSWLFTKTAASAAREARQSIYAIVGNEGDLYDISKYSRKGVKLHILIGIGTAKRSTQLKSLLARGAVIWVDTRAGVSRTMLVVDKGYVYDARGTALNEDPKTSGWRSDESLAQEYIRQWHDAVAPNAVVPCR